MNQYPLATVGGLIVAPDGDILLVQSKKWHDLYSLPGGKVEEGETREEAFRREVLEETGLQLAHVQFAIVQDCIFSPEFWHHKHFIMNDFIADLHPDSTKSSVVLNDEAYSYRWVHPKQALYLSLQEHCRYLIEWYLTHVLSEEHPIGGLIGIVDHRINCIIGLLPHEREHEQTIYVDVKVQTDVSACVHSDQLVGTIDYVKIAQRCTDLAQEKKYHMIETFAYELLQVLLMEFNIVWGWVRVKKPAAIATAAYAVVELERKR